MLSTNSKKRLLEAKKYSGGIADRLFMWSSIASGSYNISGLNDMAICLKDFIKANIEEPELIDLKPSLDFAGNKVETGKAIMLQKRSKSAINVLLFGHYDSVFDTESKFKPNYCENNSDILYGQAVADMKGGLLTMLTSLIFFEQSEVANNIGWTVLIVPDEEIGSVCSKNLILETAKNIDMAIGFEPAMPDGSIIKSRAGSGNFSITAHGKAAHSGREPFSGKSAIHALAKVAIRLHEINTLDNNYYINVAQIEGGEALNQIPEKSNIKINIRAIDINAAKEASNIIEKIVAEISMETGVRMDIGGNFHRPPKPYTTEQEQLFLAIENCARYLEQPFITKNTKGCCDGNNLLAAGIPNIDNLGVLGGNIHSDEEYMLLSSLPDRTELITCFLLAIAEGTITPVESR